MDASFVLLLVADPARSATFYEKLLGRAPFERSPTFAGFKLNDQHGYLKGPADAPWKVGDRVAFGVSHPCTTFDRWQLIYLVDDAYNVTGAIRTFF